MLRSETTSKVFAAFVAAQAELPTITKSRTVKVQTRTGRDYNFKYAPLDAAIDVVKPIYAKHGLAVTQLLSVNGIETFIVHTSGEFFGSTWAIEEHLQKWADAFVDGNKIQRLEPVNPQEAGSVITYFKRYAYSAINNISLDDDDDGNLASGNTAEIVDKAEMARQKAASTPPKQTPRKPVAAPASPEPQPTVAESTPTPEPVAETPPAETPPWEEKFSFTSQTWDEVYETKLREELSHAKTVVDLMGRVQGLMKEINSAHGATVKAQWRERFQPIVQELASTKTK
jgi:hypothetical protein